MYSRSFHIFAEGLDLRSAGFPPATVRLEPTNIWISDNETAWSLNLGHPVAISRFEPLPLHIERFIARKGQAPSHKHCDKNSQDAYTYGSRSSLAQARIRGYLDSWNVYLTNRGASQTGYPQATWKCV